MAAYTKEKAEALLAELKAGEELAGDEAAWTYSIAAPPEGKGLYRIEVRDEEGHYMGDI